MTVTKSGDIPFENAAREAAEGLKGMCHNAENRSLKEMMRKQDSLFVEVLKEMKHKMDRIEEKQQQLAASTPEEPELDSPESSLQQPESESETDNI